MYKLNSKSKKLKAQNTGIHRFYNLRALSRARAKRGCHSLGPSGFQAIHCLDPYYLTYKWIYVGRFIKLQMYIFIMYNGTIMHDTETTMNITKVKMHSTQTYNV